MKEEVKNNPNLNLEEDDTTYNFERVLRLTTWASIISRLFFIIGIAILILHLYDFFINFNMPYIDSYDILFFLIIFGICLIFIFLGLFLQFIIEGIYLLVDIEQNTRDKANSNIVS